MQLWFPRPRLGFREVLSLADLIPKVFGISDLEEGLGVPTHGSNTQAVFFGV